MVAVASPALLPSEVSRRRFCTATFDGTRYMFYAVDTFLVILSENHEQAIHNNPRSEAKRCSQFDLRQVWSVQAKVNCVAFNPIGKRVARGAVALCIDDKRIVLLTPTGAPTTTPVAAAAATAMASKLAVKTSDADLQPVSKRRPSVFTGRTSTDVSNEYAKVHLYLQLPTWKESIRWRSEDQHLDRVKWVESGDDLLLVGAGEKISVWKIVEESGLQAYLQHSFNIGEPEHRIWHFDVTHTGRYVASAREHDRILKVWSIGELAHDGKPISLFLPHQRALVSVQWAKNWHSYKIRHHDPLMPRVEMLYALDKNGDISIWREHVASSHRSFVLWRRFTTQDFLLSSSCTVDSERVDDGSLQHVLASRLRSFGLVQNNWGRPTPRAPMTITDALLERNTVLSALSLFHYGYASIDEVRRNELTNQRMDGIGKIHSKLLGDRRGMIADTHSGETLLNGNTPLNKTFVVTLAYAVHENGDFSLFRVESVHFSAVAPRVALLCVFSGLREQLVDATVYSICSSDYKDRENGSSTFIVEIVFQPQREERHAKIARLKFQAESTVFGARDSRAMASYSVQISIGVIQLDSTSIEGSWKLGWSSSRFDIKPRGLSSMQAYPNALVALDAGIARLDLKDFSQFVTPESSQTVLSGVIANAVHPLTLLFLLMRGSFKSLDQIVVHIRKSIVEHEKTCYLKMTENADLRNLPLLELENLFGKPVNTTQEDERPLAYRNGKGASQGTAAAAVSSAPARASDLFAMDFGSSRRFGRDRAEDLFAPRVPAISSDSTSSTEASQVPDKLELESDGLLAFFDEHKGFLAFVPDSYRPVFLNIIKNAKKIIQWERNTGKAKDEAALRFITSLMWPYKSSDVGPKNSVELESADASDSSPSGICSEQIAWAAVSDCQAELLEECFPPTMTLSMKDLTQLRLPFWVKSATRLTQYAEKVAQAEYASTRDPFRVALLYVLLGKIKLLSNLFNMGNEKKIAELLRNDFSDERWKIAAVKNAYVLKAKCRYELSATFFLLGGKVQEAMSVIENEDPSLVLSFLIARLSEKWDLGGQGDESGGYNAFNDASFTGLSTSLRSFGADGGRTGSNCKDVCKEYLKTTVFEKAQRCGDIYMCFLVKYYIGETANAIQCLLTVPKVEMRCVFDGPPSTGSQLGDSRLYWGVFGQSLLGAIDLVRFLRPIIRPLSTSIKTQMVRTQALTLNRLVGSGWNVMALYQQQDFAEQFKQFCRDNASDSSLRGTFLSIRNRILCNIISEQTVSLAISTAKRISQSLNQRASFESSLPIEQRLKAEIMCLIRRSGAFSIDEIEKSKDDTVEQALRSAVVETLSHSDQNYLLDFILQEWSSKDPARSPMSNPLPQLIEKIVDNLSWIASGDLTTLGTTHFHSRRIDQLCSELLTSAESLLCWLAYYFAKPTEERSVFHSSAEYIRVISASVYSIICVCCRYIKSPCCLHRALTAIFPHMDSLPKKILDEIKEISLADVCANCSTSRVGADAEASAGPPLPSLQQDISVLYQVIQMLQRDLNLFVEEVRTNRLDLMPPAASQFTYCQYWTLSVMLAVSGMPTHISRVAVDGANPHALSTTLAKRLVQTWITHNANMSKYATRLLLCELIESYFRPFDLQRPSTPTGASSKDNSGGTPTISPTAAGMANVISPNHRDRRESRQLLRCSCDRCPWLLILKIFADKDELLLRINSQLECCSEKIKEDISWGHLPDFPSKKSVFTRSQKILLSSAGAGKAAEITDLLERRFQHSTPAITVSTNCIYRSEVSIKSLCFNQSTETGEMVLCSSKGICRAASVEYSDGTKYQFKGMYANPQAAFFSDTNAGTSGIPVSRRRSADTSLMSRGTTDSPQKGLDSPSLLSATGLSEMKTPSFKPSAVESHPFLPLFVSGNQKGKIHLWSYESLSSVCEFQTKEVVTTYQLSPATSSRRDIKRLQFDSLGQQMGAVDTFGRLFMWKFANLEREACYREIECHDKGAKALKFINSGTIVATVGTSTDKRSMCMWDLLLPSSKALIAAPTCHPAGAASLAFSQAHQLVISGGEGGSISVFDVRQRRVLHTISNAHETAITTLELHPSGRCVLSGSASGDVKIWSLPIFRELVSVSKVHAKPSFLGDAASNLLGDAASNMAINVTNSSWGVTDAVATDDYFFTSGTDGSVQRFKVPSFDKLY
ncbi:hypothetical protein Poli38472_006013 [Pythium oligandrum]|uniref:RAVE complex protein Rav1 C-terminal domain-containing protein n=1 Tax=Pythium oligandrum TaxID=41045 RepID=A0A8K1CS51_PYTOL|nr:hypothetical protein Poli38472_006013 [Pythium oligandrum]|eukprot:TMW68545.1 hypothetical protein Poli38472_006013 [Pythium oligandrum]